MKFIMIYFSVVVVFQLQAQDCNFADHSTNVFDSWISCEEATNPNPDREDSHWVMYDLGFIYQVGTTKFWNYNRTNGTDQGVKNIAIDYSVNGVNWSEAAIFQLTEATGETSYQGEEGPHLGNVDARYILISILDTWGDGDCAGLSELRIDVSDQTTDLQDLYIDNSSIIFYPNPTSGHFVVKGILDNYDITITNIMGEVVENLSDAIGEADIDLSALPDGLYFIVITNQLNDRLSFQQIIKQ